VTAVHKFPLAVICCFAALVVGAAAFAQEVPKRRTFTAPPAQPAPKAQPSKTVKTVQEMAEEIVLPLHKAKVLTLSRSITRAVVGDPDVMDVEHDEEQPNKIILRPQAVGLTNVFFMDDKGEIIRQAEVRVVFDNQGIKSALKNLLPNENITVTAFRNSVFLSGKVSSAAAALNAVTIASQFVADAANVVNMLGVAGGQQVILQVRVAEMDRNVIKELRVDSTLTKTFSNLGDRGLTATGSTVAFTVPAVVTGTLFPGGGVISSATFNALERQNLARTLAEPTLMALSGESATFLDGGSVPIPTSVTDSGTVYEYQEFGIRLIFTPVVINHGRINLAVETEISSVDFTNTVNNFPSLVQKRTTTTVEMPSGGSLMIAGLLRDDMGNTADGWPFLKDLPVLGALFRSTLFVQQRTELVVTVTAYLVGSIDSARNLAAPTDGFEDATNIDLYVWGRMHRHYTDSEETFWDNPLKGPFGYIMK